MVNEKSFTLHHCWAELEYDEEWKAMMCWMCPTKFSRALSVMLKLLKHQLRKENPHTQLCF
jgi:hypothetical protein